MNIKNMILKSLVILGILLCPKISTSLGASPDLNLYWADKIHDLIDTTIYNNIEKFKKDALDAIKKHQKKIITTAAILFGLRVLYVHGYFAWAATMSSLYTEAKKINHERDVLNKQKNNAQQTNTQSHEEYNAACHHHDALSQEKSILESKKASLDTQKQEQQEIVRKQEEELDRTTSEYTSLLNTHDAYTNLGALVPKAQKELEELNKERQKLLSEFKKKDS